MPQIITVSRAEAHEALYLKLETLARLAASVAARNPRAPVPEPARIQAETLIYDCRPFGGDQVRPRSLKRGGIEPVAPTYGGLSARLAEALAGLEAFEGRHTRWDGRLKCLVWCVTGDPLPVRRHNPRPVALPGKSEADKRENERMRRKVYGRINELIAEGYEAGYADARAGRPSTPPETMTLRIDRHDDG